MSIANIELRHPTDHHWEDCEQIAGWLNNKEHMRYSEQRHKVHTARTVEIYRKNFDQIDNLLWDIHLLGANDELIGTITAYVDPPNRRADLGILISPMYAGGGYGTRAWRMAMGYLRKRVDVIGAGMMLDNKAMRRICEKGGMEPAGFIVDQFLLNGEREPCMFFKWKRTQS